MARHSFTSRLWQTGSILLLDVGIIALSTVSAYFIRFQGVVPPDFLQNVVPAAVVASLVFPAMFWLFRLYHHVWRYASIDVIFKLALSVASGLAIMTAAIVLATPESGRRPVPLSTLIIMSLFVFLGSAAIRSFGRLVMYVQAQSSRATARPVVILGAGDAGSLLLRDIESRPQLDLNVVGFLDDDHGLHRRLIRGVRVLGPMSDLPRIAEERSVSEAFLAIPSAPSEQRRRILDMCSDAGVKVRIVPSLAIQAGPAVDTLRRVEVEDLLGRDTVDIDLEGIRDRLAGKTVAVTGAAGSIGSELCRQLAVFGARRLLLVEIDETRLYEIYLELLDRGDVEPVMHICDIRDDRKLTEIFLVERPHIVIHAAAYKHVPLMEIAPDEAIKTNVGGTRNVVRAAEAAGVEDFVLISTDKAVAPTTVMGLSKAIAERVAIDACTRGLRASAVRFGNVLGSRGSVVPLFEEQLRRGRPLRVTHPEVTRYFMTIPEAARLVLQSLAISAGGEIFVLEMGDPVKIVDLARKMIVLSGATTRIEFTGLRPAEKLHEVLADAEEELIPTGRPKIDRIGALPLPPEDLDQTLNALGMFARLNDRTGMKAYLASLMPDFVGYGENLMPDEAHVPAREPAGLDPEMETLF